MVHYLFLISRTKCLHFMFNRIFDSIQNSNVETSDHDVDYSMHKDSNTVFTKHSQIDTNKETEMKKTHEQVFLRNFSVVIFLFELNFSSSQKVMKRSFVIKGYGLMTNHLTFRNIFFSDLISKIYLCFVYLVFCRVLQRFSFISVGEG